MEGFVFDLLLELLDEFFHPVVLFGSVEGGLGFFCLGEGVCFFECGLGWIGAEWGRLLEDVLLEF